MQWAVHDLKTAYRHRTWASIVVAVVAVAVVGGLAALGVAVLAGGDDAAEAADVTSDDFVELVLGDAGVSSEEFVDDVVDGLLGELPPGVDHEQAIEGLAAALGLESTDPAELADSLVRRLDIDPAAVDDVDDLVAQLIEAIDPAGEIETLDDLVAAVERWAATTSPHVLRIGHASETDLSSMSFENAVAVVEQGSSQLIDVSLAPMSGLDPVVGSGGSIAIDRADRAIAIVGRTDDESAGIDAELFVVARWTGPTPDVVAGLALSDWELSTVGFAGDVGRTAIPAATVLLTDDGVDWSAGVPDVDGWSPPMAAAVPLESGVTLVSTLDEEVLPDVVRAAFDGGSGSSTIRLVGSIGPSFAAVTGDAVPDAVTVELSVDGLAPPALPSWLAVAPDRPWVLSLAHAGGATEVALAGDLDLTLDDEPRRLNARVVSESADGDTTVTLEAAMPAWSRPFGVGWLELSDITLTGDLSATSTARFAADAVVAGRDASIEILVDEAGSVEMLASVERLAASDAVELVGASTGAALPARLPDVAIDDVVIEIAVADGTTVSMGGVAGVAGQQADVLVGVESAGGASGVVLGVALEAWSLADLVPSADGTVLDVLEFPPSVLVLSSLDGTVEPTALSRPAQRFFGAVEGGPLTLAPGVSLFSSLDLSGTSLEAPLAALGYGEGRFPVTGTIPGSALGMDGGSGGSGLDGLALAVALPDVAPANSPDWLSGASLSLVASGQPSLGLQGRMTTEIDGEALEFVVGAEFARTQLGTEMALFGELETDRPWESPFGIEWLIVNGLTVELSIDPIGTVGLGFAGDVVIGEKSLRGVLGVDLSPAGVPTNLILAARSAEGISTNDLFAIQRTMASAAGSNLTIDSSNYPELLLRNVDLRFAPQTSERLGVEAGFVVAGEAYAAVGGGEPVRFAPLDVRLTENGLYAAGALAAYELGPLEWSDIELELELSQDRQAFLFDGGVSLLGVGVDAEIDLSTDSIVFSGQEALAELERIVDTFERILADPAGAIEQAPTVFADAGVDLPEWADELFARIADLVAQDQDVGAFAIDAILNGGSIPLSAAPSGGAELRCPTFAPQFDDGRCYTTLALESADGLPEGGRAPACVFPNLSEYKGRCYTTKPKTVKRCPTGTVATLDPETCRQLTAPWGEVDKVDKKIAGIPKNGVAKSCALPFESGGRCYTVPPGELLPPVPEDGADLICGVETPIEEGGRCWRITPSMAERGIGVEGICKKYVGVSCSLDDLVRANLLGLLVDGLVDRFDNW